MPSSPASTSRYILTALAIILVITAFILVGLNAMNVDTSVGSMLSRKPSQEELNESYKAGYLAARAKFPAPSIDDDFSLTGVVVSTSNGSLVVHGTSLDTDMIVDGVSDDRTIIVDNSTVIRKGTEKDPEALNRELETNPDAASMTFTNITLQDIPVGARVRVRSNASIRLLETIQAVELTLLP